MSLLLPTTKNGALEPFSVGNERNPYRPTKIMSTGKMEPAKRVFGDRDFMGAL